MANLQDNVDKLWDDNHLTCPWYGESAICLGQVSYNGHVNNPHYANCERHICPFFHWATAVMEKQQAEKVCHDSAKKNGKTTS